MFERISVIQVDSVNVLVRSQELPLFARLGPHPRTLLPDAIDDGELFEYWAHMAAIVPTAHHPLFRWRMEQPHHWQAVARLGRDRPAFIEDVFERIRRHTSNPLRAYADIALLVSAHDERPYIEPCCTTPACSTCSTACSCCCAKDAAIAWHSCRPTWNGSSRCWIPERAALGQHAPIHCLASCVAAGHCCPAGCAHLAGRAGEAARWQPSRQLVLVTTPDWDSDHGTLQAYERDAGGWREVGARRR